MYQQITILGNLGNDPDTRWLDTDTCVSNFNVAVNRSYKKDGKKMQDTTWFKVSTWGGLAEVCNEYLSKGDLVLVAGTMKSPNIWTGEDGEPHCNLELTAKTVQFANTKSQRSKKEDSEEDYPVDDDGLDDDGLF